MDAWWLRLPVGIGQAQSQIDFFKFRTPQFQKIPLRFLVFPKIPKFEYLFDFFFLTTENKATKRRFSRNLRWVKQKGKPKGLVSPDSHSKNSKNEIEEWRSFKVSSLWPSVQFTESPCAIWWVSRETPPETSLKISKASWLCESKSLFHNEEFYPVSYSTRIEEYCGLIHKEPIEFFANCIFQLTSCFRIFLSHGFRFWVIRTLKLTSHRIYYFFGRRAQVSILFSSWTAWWMFSLNFLAQFSGSIFLFYWPIVVWIFPQGFGQNQAIVFLSSTLIDFLFSWCGPFSFARFELDVGRFV